ncbi:adenylosuccinate synthetase [Flavimarina sp. Hel_I_48]|uniref:adenylosuccinate synthetase n=1 Tax=Flavimarina sp. Hel_I_48 TaxID=1392488 RepID=UPI000E3ED1DA|nr:adenylosuccinate synthetase [Flavimarina sp. Hel_I_48]
MIQVSQDVPNNANNAPLDFSDPADVIIFIVLPVLFIILYFIWRNKKKKKP